MSVRTNHSVDSTTDRVESVAVVVGGVGVLNGTALVLPLCYVVCEVIGAVRGNQASSLGSLGKRAVLSPGVQCDSILLGFTDILDDINFSIVGPVLLPGSPKCWPNTADGGRHVGNISNEETSIIELLAFQPNTSAAALVQVLKNCCRVNSQVGLSKCVNTDQSLAFGNGLALEVDESVGWVNILSIFSIARYMAPTIHTSLKLN